MAAKGRRDSRTDGAEPPRYPTPSDTEFDAQDALNTLNRKSRTEDGGLLPSPEEAEHIAIKKVGPKDTVPGDKERN
ncbi:hypothetical protein NDU88_005461 [Pleurodeles waltl]|uniref:Uncharacterized protein n=1 Tax=Pleurodeles waltl TaxID=8319 RepID=A0AAV7QJ44_PLEWA|nr:hypothetical protein NDU88_005461 [Pleurodeles waltl]